MSGALGAGRQLGRRHAGLGARRIWWGMLILVGIQMAYDLGQTIGGDAQQVAPELVLTAWGVLLVADLAVIVVVRVLNDHLPNWMFGLFVAALVIVILLDLTVTWMRPEAGSPVTVGRSAVLSLLLALTTRPEREVLIAGLGLAALCAAGMALDGAFVPPTMQHSIFTICHVSLTIVVATIAIAGFRAMVRREIEEELSRAALLAPQLTVGIYQSERLARLDLAAESLLAAVAEGRVQLPLNEEIARRAGSIASELRHHLLESRSRTWLDLAIEESELLGAAVRVTDDSASAGLLGPDQRSALLSVLWLLAEPRRPRRDALTPTLVTVSQPMLGPSTRPDMIALPVSVQFGSDQRARLEPGVWERFGRIGEYREVREQGTLRVDILALVPNAGHRSLEPR
ncbi:MAG TPA: hypothetical protein VNQ48_02750 [Microbacteriaceae bacterium]|nr:hypothetical protein [Microbacteriaceae bacterium]